MTEHGQRRRCAGALEFPVATRLGDIGTGGTTRNGGAPAAAGVTFYALLAIFPAGGACIDLWPLREPSTFPLLGLTNCTPLAGSHSTGR